jgi:L-rhamnose mutarotase
LTAGAGGGPGPRRVGAVVKLRADHEERYRQLHREVWPGVLDMLRAAHVTNYTIFFRDGMLFSYLEYTGDDYAADMARIAADPTTQEWWALTSPCQEPLGTAAPGEVWAPGEELFHLD